MSKTDRIRNMVKLSNFHAKSKSKLLMYFKTVEELVSLSKEVCKFAVNTELGLPIDLNELLDEMFDAEFMIFQLKRLFLVDEYSRDKYELIANAKIEREMERWNIQ